MFLLRILTKDSLRSFKQKIIEPTDREKKKTGRLRENRGQKKLRKKIKKRGNQRGRERENKTNKGDERDRT